MAHPMGMLISNYNGMGSPQMGDIFSDLLSNLQKSVVTGAQKAEQDAISKTLQTIIKQPEVQQAVIQSGNDAAINSLATQLRNAQLSTVSAVKNNPMTTALVVGGLGVGAVLLFMAIRK